MFSRWRRGLHSIRTYSFRPFRPMSSKPYRRSGHSTFTARVSFVLSAGIDLQSARGHRGAGKPCRLSAGPISMRACDSDRQRYVPQLEKERSGRAKLRSGAHGIVRHMVLSGRHKDRSAPIIDWALKLGFGAKCGIPLRGEVEGRIPNDEFMKATHDRKILNGDIANMSIGQGNIRSRHCRWRRPWGLSPTAERFTKHDWFSRCRRSTIKS